MLKRLVFASASILTALTPAATFAQTPPFLTQWGTYGLGPGEFVSPSGVAVNATGTVVYVSDESVFRVQAFTNSGTYLLQWGFYAGASQPGGFGTRSPQGLAVDAAGQVYACDYANNRVELFTSGGTYLDQWHIYYAADVALHDDRFYTTNQLFHKVEVITVAGQYVTQWGTQGTGPGQFVNPAGIAVGSNGIVYVADSGNHRVQMFTIAGAYLGEWGTEGSGDGQFKGAYGPQGLALDATGNVYVADSGNHRIQVFTPDGAYLAKWGTLGNGPGEFNHPWGLAIDASGNVYVVDSANFRVQVFGYAPTPTRAASWGHLKTLYR